MTKFATIIDRLLGWLVEKVRWRPLHTVFRWLLGHWRAFLKFGAVGGGVFLAGVGLLYVLVSILGLNSLVAYAIQAVFSVELSFILNYHWTWKERKPTDPRERRRYFWRSLWRWNLKKTVTASVNQAIYTGLIELHVQYMIANIATTALFTFINYFLGDKWTFAVPKLRKGRHRRSERHHRKPRK